MQSSGFSACNAQAQSDMSSTFWKQLAQDRLLKGLAFRMPKSEIWLIFRKYEQGHHSQKQIQSGNPSRASFAKATTRNRICGWSQTPARQGVTKRQQFEHQEVRQQQHLQKLIFVGDCRILDATWKTKLLLAESKCWWSDTFRAKPRRILVGLLMLAKAESQPDTLQLSNSIIGGLVC